LEKLPENKNIISFAVCALAAITVTVVLILVIDVHFQAICVKPPLMRRSEVHPVIRGVTRNPCGKIQAPCITTQSSPAVTHCLLAASQ
jgi:hypothetical protein